MFEEFYEKEFYGNLWGGYAVEGLFFRVFIAEGMDKKTFIKVKYPPSNNKRHLMEITNSYN